jgi:hypothetical protein
MSNGWKSNQAPLMQRISQIATGAGSLFVFAAGSRLALALPADRRAARIVADLYQPQRLRGRLFHGIAKWMITFGIPAVRPTHPRTDGLIPEVAWLKEAALQGSIGFLGCNPSHGYRCILAGVDPNSGEKFVAKLGLDEGATSVTREHAMLVQLHGKYPGVLRSLGCETGDGWSLLRLPHLGDAGPKRIGQRGVAELLHSWIGTQRVPLAEIAWAKRLLEQARRNGAPAAWCSKLLARPINQALIHGDFAVWNTRRPQNTIYQEKVDAEESLVALDWEWSEEHGVAGVDLAHGLRQESYMVYRMKPAKAVAWMLAQAANPRWSQYLEACGWKDAYEDWLRLGLLHSHFNAKNESANLLKELSLNVTHEIYTK